MARTGLTQREGSESLVDGFFSIVGYTFNFLTRGTFRRRKIQDFAEHARIIVERGLPLAEGIERFGESQRSLGVRYVMRSMADLLRRGVPFHEAMQHHSPTFFPADVVSMVRAGESAGMLPEALGNVVEDLTFHRDVKLRYTLTFGYLTFLFFYVLGVSSIIFTYVMPRFVEFWDQSDTALPQATLMVLKPGGSELAGLLFRFIPVLFPIAALFVFILSRFEHGIPEFLAFCLPGVRGAFIRYQKGRFLSALGMFLEGREPAEAAVAAAAKVSRFRPLRRLSEGAGDLLRDGVSLSEVLGMRRVFDPKSIWRIRSAERRGDLPQVLMNIGSEMQEAGHRRWIYLLAWLRPAAIIVIAVFEFLVVRATYAPLFDMTNLIGGEYL